MKKTLLIISGVFVLVAAGIALYTYLATPHDAQDFLKNDKFIKGYVFNSLPSDAEENGYIYAVEKTTNDNLYVTTIDVPKSTHPITLPDDSNLTTATYGTLLNWLAKKKSADSVGNVNLSTKVNVKLKFDGGVLTQTGILDAAKNIRNANKQINDSLKTVVDVDNYNFYIVVETVKAKQLDYEFDKSLAANEKFKLDVNKLASSVSTVKLNDGKNMKLQFQDTAYRVVLYKSLKLNLEKKLTGHYEITVDQQK
jgi:hypothetical protein